MDPDVLTWEALSLDTVYWYLCILFLVILCVALFSDEMKRKNKIIIMVISAAILLSLPAARRIAIKDYIVKNDYSLIVDRGLVWTQYEETDPEEYLWRHVFLAVEVNSENKLIYIAPGRSAITPRSLDEIAFFDEAEEGAKQ